MGKHGWTGPPIRLINSSPAWVKPAREDIVERSCLQLSLILHYPFKNFIIYFLLKKHYDIFTILSGKKIADILWLPSMTHSLLIRNGKLQITCFCYFFLKSAPGMRLSRCGEISGHLLIQSFKEPAVSDGWRAKPMGHLYLEGGGAP